MELRYAPGCLGTIRPFIPRSSSLQPVPFFSFPLLFIVPFLNSLFFLWSLLLLRRTVRVGFAFVHFDAPPLFFFYSVSADNAFSAAASLLPMDRSAELCKALAVHMASLMDRYDSATARR